VVTRQPPKKKQKAPALQHNEMAKSRDVKNRVRIRLHDGKCGKKATIADEKKKKLKMSVFGKGGVRREITLRRKALCKYFRVPVPRTMTQETFHPRPATSSSSAISQHMVYPRRYSARTHFGNRGTADVRVERRLAPSGGDDKSSCGWRGSGSGSFYGSPSRKEENSHGWGRARAADGYLILSCKRRRWRYTTQ